MLSLSALLAGMANPPYVYQAEFYAIYGCAVLADSITAASLVYYLWTFRTGIRRYLPRLNFPISKHNVVSANPRHHRTNSLLTFVMLFGINTGLLTCMAHITTLITVCRSKSISSPQLLTLSLPSLSPWIISFTSAFLLVLRSVRVNFVYLFPITRVAWDGCRLLDTWHFSLLWRIPSKPQLSRLLENEVSAGFYHYNSNDENTQLRWAWERQWRPFPRRTRIELARQASHQWNKNLSYSSISHFPSCHSSYHSSSREGSNRRGTVLLRIS